MKRAVLIALTLLWATHAYAQQDPYLVSPSGKYLGTLSSNPYDANSVSNPYGQYGSPYSSDSINNPYGQYGSPYSNQSPNNPYASQPPIIVQPCSGFYC